jgi:hypothetical protein
MAALGSLNASHASAEALAHAAPGSVVGEIAAYKTAIEAYLAGQSSLQSLLAPDPGCTSAACAARNSICCQLNLRGRRLPTNR